MSETAQRCRPRTLPARRTLHGRSSFRRSKASCTRIYPIYVHVPVVKINCAPFPAGFNPTGYSPSRIATKMRITSYLITSALLALSVAAPPAQEILGLRPAACSTKLPSSYQQIAQEYPKQTFPQTSSVFKVSQHSGGVKNVNTLLRFSGIPKNAYGCQLTMSFPPGYPIQNTGSSQVNVYRLLNNINSTDTYETYYPGGGRGLPKDGFLFATVTILGQRAVLNSESCKEDLNYLFAIASETKEGGVTFFDSGTNPSGLSGFYISYNC